jgi:threonine/homoserine/homoserine lactone efflux protein
MLWTFLPVAALLTITPGVATALVVRSAARGGTRAALSTIAGNSLGVLAWAGLAAVGLAAVVAASAAAFTTVKLIGAVVLIVLGIQGLLARKTRAEEEAPAVAGRSALRDALLTSLTNPKLAVFFVALFPQFVPDGAPVLPRALLMAATILVLDVCWYTALAFGVTRAKRAFVEGPWMRRVERLTGGVLVGLGLRLAVERR